MGRLQWCVVSGICGSVQENERTGEGVAVLLNDVLGVCQVLRM